MTQGYGTFWLADMMTLASEGKVHVLTVSGTDMKVSRWLQGPVSTVQNAQFMLVDDTTFDGITMNSVIETVGKPNEVTNVDISSTSWKPSIYAESVTGFDTNSDIHIMAYDKNIAQYVIGSGYPGITLTDWWSLNDWETSKTYEVTNKHFLSKFAAGSNGFFTSNKAGDLVYGPYKSLEAGTYDITFEYTYTDGTPVGTKLGHADACANSGKMLFAQNDPDGVLTASGNGKGSVTLHVTVPNDVKDFETRVFADVAGLQVQQITVARSA